MKNGQSEPVNILYIDEDTSFHELVSVALPKYGEFTVFTASTLPAAVDVLSKEQIDGVILADTFPEASEEEVHSVLNELENDALIRITTDTNDAETTIATSSREDSKFQESIVTKRFVELIARVEILVGKHCIGYELRPRSYSINNFYTNREEHDDINHENIRSDRGNRIQDSSESSLIELHEATTDLMQAETIDEILTTVLDAADNILRLPAAAIYRWDEEAGFLRPYEATAETKALFGELPTFTGPDSLAWDAFIDGEFRVYDDVQQQQTRYNSKTVIEEELFAPLGEHGILISGATESGAFNTVNVRATQTLAANTIAALDLVDRKQELTHQQQQLRQQNKQLTTLKRINNVIRDIGRITVTSSTQSEIEQTICEKLTAIESYRFAWIGQRKYDDELHARYWSGTNGEFLDHLCGDVEKPSEHIPPAEKALRTDEVQVTQNIFTDESFAPWRKAALNRGFQSAISLPLSYQQTTYGVLEIYASNPNAFEGEEQDAFGELGEIIANAFSAIERKQALLSDTQTELELQMNDQDDVFSRMARGANAEIELDTVISRDDGTWLIYLTTTEVDSSALLSVIRELTIVESTQQIRGGEDTDLYGVVLTEFELGELLATHGAKLKTIQALPDETTLVVSVPEKADVRTVITTCQNRYPSIELARRNSDVDDGTLDQDIRDVESLTDKQRDALEVALKQGFFAWPRDKTGEEIAESLGVTPPTFHRHVRMGLEELLQETLGQNLR